MKIGLHGNVARFCVLINPDLRPLKGNAKLYTVIYRECDDYSHKSHEKLIYGIVVHLLGEHSSQGAAHYCTGHHHQ